MLAATESKQMEEEDIHDIFIINPLEQADYTQKNVEVTLKNSEVLQGVVYTIDPVSQSVVLISSDGSKTSSVKVIMKHSIQTIKKISDFDEKQKIYLDIFKDETKDLSFEQQKEKVKSWLEKNLIPVAEVDKILKVDALEIHPPYGPDQCFSGNSIVLSRIQTLLNQMPSDFT